ncbi:MAG TPA: antimetabolite toxin biosynthesis protein MgoB [Lentisphaeria bacterium]|nr:antimetabolite toxin biosynthesis protein MgoB [Lentisphaeria bacterium]
MIKIEISEITKKQKSLENHHVFSVVQNIDDLRVFMSWHVFAVWDFMCLVKRLQRDLTSVESLWVPPDSPLAARLMNEIVLGEESDEAPDGSYISHFELYLLAMKEIGADTRLIENFIDLIRKNMPVEEAMKTLSVDTHIQNFVNNTINTVVNGNLYQVLGSFVFGREHVIPNMFKGLLDAWHIDENDAPMFVYYLKRHIELDGDEHGPAALKIIQILTKGNQTSIKQLTSSAIDAINDRTALWDGMEKAISRGKTM